MIAVANASRVNDATILVHDSGVNEHAVKLHCH
jgi:hypothetical protein